MGLIRPYGAGMCVIYEPRVSPVATIATSLWDEGSQLSEKIGQLKMPAQDGKTQKYPGGI